MASPTAVEAPAAAAPRRAPPSRLVLAGLATGLLVGGGAIGWVGAAGQGATAKVGERRLALTTMGAVAELVAAVDAAGHELGPALASFAATQPEIVSLRVVDLATRSLAASTVPADAATGPLPLRLSREVEDHKTWYDRGQALRAAVEANRDEGRTYKAEIEVAERPGGGLSLAAPLEREGAISGVILAELTPRGPSGGASLAASLLPILGGAFLLALAAAALLRERPWARLAVAGVLLVAALGVAAWQTLDALGAGRQKIEVAAGERATAAAKTVAAVLGSPDAAPALDRFDLDVFRQPRGVLDATGVVNAARVAELFAPIRARFRNGLGLIGLLAVGAAAFVGAGAAGRAWQTFRTYREAYAYVTPALLGMLVLVFFPFFYGLALSFTGQTLYNLNEPLYAIWTGFSNYVDILTDFDLTRVADDGSRTINYQNFYWTLFFTTVWTVANVSLGVTVGLLLALLLNTRGLAFRPIYRVILILPWAIPNYITALIWKGLFHQQFGVVNQVVQLVGMEPVAWFDKVWTSFATVLATNAWLSFPFMMVVSLGALQSIPADLYEAARVDGASRWQQFRLVTLPSLKPALVPAVILSVVWTFNMFNIIYLVSAGDPGGATEILVTRSYKLAFEQYQYGYAAAYATVIFGILLVYGTWQNRVTKASEGL